MYQIYEAWGGFSLRSRMLRKTDNLIFFWGKYMRFSQSNWLCMSNSSRFILFYEAFCFVTQSCSYQRIFFKMDSSIVDHYSKLPLSTMVRVTTARRPAGRRSVAASVSRPSDDTVVINPILRHMDLSTKIRSLRTKESKKKHIYLKQLYLRSG